MGRSGGREAERRRAVGDSGEGTQGGGGEERRRAVGDSGEGTQGEGGEAGRRKYIGGEVRRGLGEKEREKGGEEERRRGGEGRSRGIIGEEVRRRVCREEVSGEGGGKENERWRRGVEERSRG